MTKINLSNIKFTETVIPQTPVDITFNSGTELKTAQNRGINCILNISCPNGQEYFLSTDFSGNTAYSNTVKQTFTYTNTYSYIVRNSKSILNEFRFELNSPENRQLITDRLNVLLEDVQLNGGIESYGVICNESNNSETTIAQNIIIIDISFKPIQSPSIVSLNFTI